MEITTIHESVADENFQAIHNLNPFSTSITYIIADVSIRYFKRLSPVLLLVS